MTKTDVERIVEEEVLISAYNLLEDRTDGEKEVVIKKEDDHFLVYQTDEHAKMIGHPVILLGEEDAFDIFLSKLRAIKTQEFNQLFEDKGAKRVLRETINKTFVSRHDFETTYHELYKAKGGKCFSVVRIDPAPGGYGEEYMYIKEVYELDIAVKENSFFDEELLQLVFSEGEKVELR